MSIEKPNFESTYNPEQETSSLPNPVLSDRTQQPSFSSDRTQEAIKSLRGEYGQDGGTTSDAQSKYDQFKSEQLQGDYGQSGKQSDSTPATSEPTEDIKS